MADKLGFFRRMLRTAGEVAVLSQQLAFYEEENKKLVWKNEQLDKEVRKERAAKDRILLRYADQISIKSGLYGKFEKDIPKVEEVNEERKILSMEEEVRIEWLAKSMQNDDIESGIEPPSLETYKDAIRKNPEQYLSA